MSGSNALVIPIRIDALLLAEQTPLAAPTVEFADLPYWTLEDGKVRDFNADKPFISDSVIAPPFVRDGYIAGPGVHLHWALPDMLTLSREAADGSIEMPAAPNRWLVTKLVGSRRQQWIVESDYLFEPEDPSLSATDAVTYPAFDSSGHASQSAALTESGIVPWRHMGRAVPADGWVEPIKPGAPATSYLDGLTGRKLTALGWGDPTFAAYYPNCRSVFGLHDASTVFTDGGTSEEITYEVIGWHADVRDDILARDQKGEEGSRFLNDAIARTRGKYSASLSGATPLNDDEIWKRTLEERFGWQFEGDGQARRSLYCGRLKIPGGSAQSQPQKPDVELALGATGMEVISAWLAQRSPKGKTLGGDALDQGKGASEARLDAVELDGLLSSSVIDQGFKFREARHARGFAPVAGGTLWSVRARDQSANQADSHSSTQPQSAPTLPLPVAAALNDLNLAQDRLDLAQAELAALRRRLYADWCFYQMTHYPALGDPPSIADPEVALNYFKEGPLSTVECRVPEIADIERDFDRAHVALQNELPPGCEIVSRAAPRYWQPVDPVLLIAGKGIEATPRHGEDGVLACTMVSITAELPGPQDFRDAVSRHLTDQAWSPPWHPLLFEWEVQVQPLTRWGNISSKGRYYDEAHITGNFCLDDGMIDPAGPLDGADLIHQEGKSSPSTLGAVEELANADAQRAVQNFSGRSILTPHAAKGFMRALAAWLLKHADGAQLPDRAALMAWAGSSSTNPLNTNDHTDEAERSAAAVRRRVADRLRDAAPARDVQLEWIVGLGWRYAVAAPDRRQRGTYALVAQPDAGAQLRGDFEEMKERLEWLATGAPGVQTQSLGGFHQALLGQRQVFQLPLADPLGFSDMKEVVSRAASAIASEGRTSPLIDNDFMPLRTGMMRLTQLWLIDTFGQVAEVVSANSEGTPTLPSGSFRKNLEPVWPEGKEHEEGWVWLPPRITQPARLDFRWLAAGSEKIEMNAHPATSPVCGWLLPNALDGTLQIHDGSGAVLGIIEETPGGMRWQIRPGAGTAVYPESIGDPTLRDVVNWIMARPPDNEILRTFLDALESAMENIHPAGIDAHQSLALLFGQPLAVVRASLGISLHGLPAAKHNREGYEQELVRAREVGELLLTTLPEIARAIDDAEKCLASDETVASTPAAIERAVQKLIEAAGPLSRTATAPELRKDLGELASVDYRLPDNISQVGYVARYRSLIDAIRGRYLFCMDRANAILGGLDRITDRFEHVKIPVRLGEWRQLDDGLAGYWEVGTDGRLADAFIASQADDPPAGEATSASILTHGAGVRTVEVVPADAPRQVVMLFDPRGQLHASCGLLPTKALSIPPEHYTKAMRSLQVFFLAAPILTQVDHPQLPLPREPGHTWTLLMRDAGGGWREIAEPAAPQPGAHFVRGQQLIDAWLRLDPLPEALSATPQASNPT